MPRRKAEGDEETMISSRTRTRTGSLPIKKIIEEPELPEPKRKSRKKSSERATAEAPKESAPTESKASSAEPKSTKQEQSEQKIHVLEKGRIFFLYRPTVGTKHPEGLPSVQKLIVILHPKEVLEEREKTKLKKSLKEFTIPRKTLPDLASGHRDQRFMRLDKASESVDDITPILQKHGYLTPSKHEEREQEEARALAEGDYAILKHHEGSSRSHSHLIYVLASKEEAIQKEFHIHKEGDFLISVKNPTVEDQFQSTGEAVSLPSHLLELWGTRKWIPLESVELLEYSGLQLLLATAKKRSQESKEVEEEIEKLEEEVEEELLPPQKIFEEFHLSKEDLEPMASGTWK